MADAIDVAKYFLKREDPDIAGTEEGCEKLQNLLGFANMISVAKYGKSLFNEPVLAEEGLERHLITVGQEFQS